MINKSVVVFGPQGCGKTLNAEKLRRHFGLQTVIDNGWDWNTPVPREGALVLTNMQPTERFASDRNVFAYADAIAAANAAA